MKLMEIFRRDFRRRDTEGMIDPGYSGTVTVDWEHYDENTGNTIPFTIDISYSGTENLGPNEPNLDSLKTVSLIGGEVNGKQYDAASLVRFFGEDCFSQEDMKEAVREYVQDEVNRAKQDVIFNRENY